MRRPGGMVAMAVVFEAGLGALALAAGWVLGHSPLVGVPGDPARALVAGALAALPLFAVLLLAERLPIPGLVELRRLAERLVPALFAGASDAQLLAVSLAAGAGEELLFRGLIQDGLAQALGAGPGGRALALVAASLLFGAAHPLSRGYALAATAVGAYLGGLMWWLGDVRAPIAAHALYDFLALRALLRSAPPAGTDA